MSHTDPTTTYAPSNWNVSFLQYDPPFSVQLSFSLLHEGLLDHFPRTFLWVKSLSFFIPHKYLHLRWHIELTGPYTLFDLFSIK